MTQILLVADDLGFRDRLGLALERLELSGEEVSFLEAANGNDALVYRPVDPFALAQVASRLLEEEQGEATLEEATS